MESIFKIFRRRTDVLSISFKVGLTDKERGNQIFQVVKRGKLNLGN